MSTNHRAQLAAINYNRAVVWAYEELEEWLGERDVGLVLAECTSEEETIEAAAAAEIFIAYKFQVTRKVLTGLPNLRLLISSSIGYDHIDLQAATDCGVVVTPATVWRMSRRSTSAWFWHWRESSVFWQGRRDRGSGGPMSSRSTASVT